MIYNDEWTEGLKRKEQDLILGYVMNNFQIFPGLAGYKTENTIRKFLNSPRGIKALQKFLEFKNQTKKSIIKYEAARLHFIRAFYNPADIINAHGNFIHDDMVDLKKLGDLAYCIEGIESEVIGINKETGKVIRKVKIKLADRTKSLEIIMKIFRLYEDTEDEDLDEKSIFEMSDDERQAEIKRLLEKDNKLIEFVKGDKKNKKKDA